MARYEHMKNIAIIGSGNFGGNLGRLFASRHTVTLGSRNPEQTRAKLPGMRRVMAAKSASRSNPSTKSSMKHWLTSIIEAVVFGISTVHAQPIDLTKTKLQPVNVSFSTKEIKGRSAVLVTKNPAIEAVDEATFVKLVGTDFKNGTIEVEVLSRLLKDAPTQARGFIGVAFRINEDNSRFESFYVRPTNGRADDQLRRNRSTQYFSYPDFKFDRLRKESPGKYESYADMALNEWIAIKIVVRDDKAKMYLNGSEHPVLLVNDLKHGADSSGAIGLWVDVGTEGFFCNLRVYHQ
jgi:hypothetical protein